jgi:signal transduction histidine kinase
METRIYFFNLLKPVGYVRQQQVKLSAIVLSVHTVFMCFVFIWEQTATYATYSINWLVFITEIKNVYSAVRIGDLNKAVCAWALKGFYNRNEKCLQRGTAWGFK